MVITYAGKSYDLGPHNFVAAGGEGTIYRHQNFAFKIFHPGVAETSTRKLKLLEKVRRSGINVALGKISPQGLAYNWVDGRPLSECVTNDFWKNFSHDRAELVATTLKEIICAAHAHNFILVDLNGNNVLLKDAEPTVIDVEAWSVPNFTVDYQTAKISPAIRDWQKKCIGKGADWFAFAILIFEFYVGLHPFRAGQIPGYGNRDWQKRMVDGKSAFLAKALSPNCRPIDGIPAMLRLWLEKTFAGERTAPPDVKGLAGFIVQRQLQRAYDHFELLLLQEYEDEVLAHDYIAGHRIITTKKGKVYVDKTSHTGSAALIIDDKTIIAIENGEHVIFPQITNALIPCEHGNWGVWNNKIYSKVGSNFYWYKVGKLGQGYYVAPEIAIPVYPYATKTFNGFCLVNAEGKKLLVTNGVYSIDHLNDFKIILGKRLGEYEFIIVGEKNSELYEFSVIIVNGKCEVISREVEYASSLATSPRKNFKVQIEQDEVRLIAGTQIKVFPGAILADIISHENENVVIALGKQLFRMKTK